MKPPEAPKFGFPTMKGSFLYRLLRPELVVKNPGILFCYRQIDRI